MRTKRTLEELSGLGHLYATYKFYKSYKYGPNGCWLWTGYTAPNGYGEWRGNRAHRAAYVIAIGPIPDGLHIDHLCRVRNCDMHYGRWQRLGDAGGAELRRKPAPPTCIIDSCDSLPHAKGLCSMHYQRAKSHGVAAAAVMDVLDERRLFNSPLKLACDGSTGGMAAGTSAPTPGGANPGIVSGGAAIPSGAGGA